MNHNVTLFEDDDYDPDDDLPAELDLESLKPDVERTRRFRALAAARGLRLDPDVVEFFKTPEAINDALRRVMNEMRNAA